MPGDRTEPRIDHALIAEVARRYGLLLVVLFGSSAKGRATERSDVDVAVLAEHRELREPDWELGLEAELGPAVPGREIDLAVLNDASPMLSFEVARSGVPLFEAVSSAFSRFRSLAARTYYDEEPRRRRQASYLARMRS